MRNSNFKLGKEYQMFLSNYDTENLVEKIFLEENETLESYSKEDIKQLKKELFNDLFLISNDVVDIYDVVNPKNDNQKEVVETMLLSYFHAVKLLMSELYQETVNCDIERDVDYIDIALDFLKKEVATEFKLKEIFT